ncbi:GNAT family N-acetyltransferase [Christiangramia sediminis]|uniref:GNAT family N-acetyltransferase n=1 Tax=Christiangramia sediminis TaxID=2881336 RepID=A0A9X1RXC8_9FLAO|nr:GNAT family N-acetyltransferase [Christiangramia sediminis]MCB7481431.1 GNAT family N-acetyltransferase [Christiangramia sediminis]
MTILAEKRIMELAFNKILKEDFNLVLPFLKKLHEQPPNDGLLKERLLEMFDQNYECFGIYKADEMIGVFGLWFMTRHYAGRACEVDHIYIEDPYQRKGVGKALMEFIHQFAESKGCETMELNTYVENFGSHKFYMNLGYIIRGYHFLKKL